MEIIREQGTISVNRSEQGSYGDWNLNFNVSHSNGANPIHGTNSNSISVNGSKDDGSFSASKYGDNFNFSFSPIGLFDAGLVTAIIAEFDVIEDELTNKEEE